MLPYSATTTDCSQLIHYHKSDHTPYKPYILQGLDSLGLAASKYPFCRGNFFGWRSGATCIKQKVTVAEKSENNIFSCI